MENTWIEKAKELYNLKVKIRRLEEQACDLMNELVELSSHQEKEVSGFELKQLVRPGSIEYKVIPQLTGIDLNRYRKSSVIYWKLNYKGEV